MKRLTFADIKKLPVQVILVTLFNVIQTLLILYILIVVFPVGWWFGIIAVLLITVNYFLLLGKKAAWTLLLLWYIILTVSIRFSTEMLNFWFDFSYGFSYLSIGLDLGEQKIRADVLSLIILIVHFSSRKYFKPKTVIDEIDEISGEDSNLE
ncbi:MAG: hypothetical protein AB8B65_08415 [Kordia sp.]|uniref:hypothetical protein n=1 Tax=Kordia sp. TaxID=1965332 RepID=UPI00385DB8A2